MLGAGQEERGTNRCSINLLLSMLPAGIGHRVVLGLAGVICCVWNPLAFSTALVLTGTGNRNSVIKYS